MCAGKSWTTAAAASIGAVEALKDQGHLWRLNNKYGVRAISSHHNKLSSSSSSSSNSSASVMADSSEVKRELDHSKPKQSEESLRTVMYLSCWGPY
ncbi:hypothetical protein IC582_000391 [Cucumis melo]|uniref:Wound-responsive family protein n=1 Tax=Cucumis melo TaxID=3656 RepID=A0A9I9DHN2_CUCME